LKICIDLTEEANGQKRLDPVAGVDKEVDRISPHPASSYKNNPIMHCVKQVLAVL